MTSRSVGRLDDLRFRKRLPAASCNGVRQSLHQTSAVSRRRTAIRDQRSSTRKKHSAEIKALKTQVTQLQAEKKELAAKVTYLQYLVETEVCKRKKLKIRNHSMAQEIDSIKKVLYDHGISSCLTWSAVQQFNGSVIKGKDLIIPPYRPSYSLKVYGGTYKKDFCRKRFAENYFQSPGCWSPGRRKSDRSFNTQSSSSQCTIKEDDTLQEAIVPDKFSKFNDWIDSSIVSCPTFSPQVVLHRLDPKIIESYMQSKKKAKIRSPSKR